MCEVVITGRSRRIGNRKIRLELDVLEYSEHIPVSLRLGEVESASEGSNMFRSIDASLTALAV